MRKKRGENKRRTTGNKDNEEYKSRVLRIRMLAALDGCLPFPGNCGVVLDISKEPLQHRKCKLVGGMRLREVCQALQKGDDAQSKTNTPNNASTGGEKLSRDRIPPELCQIHDPDETSHH
jgi:hypothetical protein